jgi:cytochrome c-type biogenesis protein
MAPVLAVDGFSVDPLAAVVGGLLSFLSPCVLALVPAYLAYLGGAGLDRERTRGGLVLNAALFVAGFSMVFILLYAVFKALVIHLPLDFRNLITQVGAVLVILLGLQFIGLFRIPLLFREGRLQVAHRLSAGNPAAAFLVGVTFGFGWTPCVGPILTFIILRASAHDLVGGTGLMLLYAAGLAVPFILTALVLERARPLMTAVNRHARVVEAASGTLLLVFGVLLFTGQFVFVNQWFGPLARYLPQG